MLFQSCMTLFLLWNINEDILRNVIFSSVQWKSTVTNCLVTKIFQNVVLCQNFHFWLFTTKAALLLSHKVKVTWHTAKYRDPYSEFVLCIWPIQSAHTQQWTHTPGAVGSHLCCGARGAVGGSVPCSRAPQSWYWGWRERCTFTPPTYNSCRPENRSRNLSITSPTL